jgi:hypothetical protein
VSPAPGSPQLSLSDLRNLTMPDMAVLLLFYNSLVSIWKNPDIPNPGVKEPGSLGGFPELDKRGVKIVVT